jgi:hypothetical protein
MEYCVTNVPEKFLTTTWSPQKDLDAIHVHTATSLHHVQDLQDPSPQSKVISMKIFDNIKYKTLFQAAIRETHVLIELQS